MMLGATFSSEYRGGSLHFMGVAAYSFFTVQGDHGSAGFGLAAGTGSGAVTLAGEVRPWGNVHWRPTLGVIARVQVPWDPQRVGEDVGGVRRITTWSLGPRLGIGPLYLIYTFEAPLAGRLAFLSFPEGRFEGERAHLFTIGATIPLGRWGFQ
jgi:hypothetical protein